MNVYVKELYDDRDELLAKIKQFNTLLTSSEYIALERKDEEGLIRKRMLVMQEYADILQKLINRSES